MSDNKGKEGFLSKDEFADTQQEVGHTSRARNKTVMLNPELASRVREHLKAEEKPAAEERKVSDPISDLLPPISWEEPVSTVSNSMTSPQSVDVFEESFDETKSRQPTGSWSRNEEPEVVEDFSAEKVINKEENKAIKSMGTENSKVKVITSKQSKLVGFLISYAEDDNGQFIELRHGRWLLSSKVSDHSEQQIIINDPTVSPLHAIIRATADGKVQVLDQLSENGTLVVRGQSGEEIELAGAMETVGHGDKLKFGKTEFVVCLIPAR